MCLHLIPTLIIFPYFSMVKTDTNAELKLNRNNLNICNIYLEINLCKYRCVSVFRHWLWRKNGSHVFIIFSSQWGTTGVKISNIHGKLFTFSSFCFDTFIFIICNRCMLLVKPRVRSLML